MKTLVVIGLSLVFVQALGQELLAQDLKVLVSPHFGASAVNNSGHLGGIYTEGVDTGAIYRNGNLHILSNPTGFNFRSVGFSDSGVLPGYLTVPGGDFAGAYYDRDGVFHHMPLLNGGTFALPQAVASDGTIVGWADSDVGLQMFSLRHGAISGIGVLSDEVILEATSTNRHGQVVGTVYRRGGHGEYMGSFYYDAVGGFVRPRNRRYSTVSEDRQIGGTFSVGDGVWHGMRIEPDGTEISYGRAFVPSSINVHGDMSGAYEGVVPRLWRNGVIENVNDLVGGDWTIERVSGFTNSGQTLSPAFRDNGSYRTQLLLTPVPEPSAFVAFGLGVAALTWKRKGKMVSR